MHLAFLTSEYPHEKVNRSAGLATSIQNLAIELVKFGHQVSIFVYSQDTAEVFVDLSITIHKIVYKKHSLFSWYFYRKDIQNYINKVIASEKIELLEVPDWTGITAFMKFKCPLIVRLHGSDAYFCHLENRNQKWKNYFFEEKALKSTNTIVSVSKYTADITKNIFGLKDKIDVIPNGIDINKFSKSTIAIKPNTLLYFGAIIRKKGVLELAHIFNKVVEQVPETKLTLLGKDVVDIFENKSTLSLFKELLSELAKSNIKHVSHVPYNEVKTYISKSSVVVLPSFAEAFPMTWLEAMAMQKALVTSNIGWANELMIDGETGYIENPKNHQEYAGKIIQLLSNITLNNFMGKNARKQIVENFAQEVIVKQNIEYYQKIIDESV